MTQAGQDSICLNVEDIGDIAAGARLLGAGGGGSTYLVELQLREAIARGEVVRVIPAQDLADDALVAACGWMGAPTVQKEKYPNGCEADCGLTIMEEILGCAIQAIFPTEIGGQNGLNPLLIAAKRDIPVVDCDGMGRAFPEAHMVTFNLKGCDAYPAVFTDEKGTSLVMRSPCNREEERIGRQIVIAMGGQCHVVDYPMLGVRLKECAVHGSLTFARGIGRAVREARQGNQDPFVALLEHLAMADPGRNACVLFDGKIIDLERRIQDGFDRGKAVLEGVGDCSGSQLEVGFQNENLIALREGSVVASVPDIITLVDRETVAALNTEELKFGQRVKVLGIGAPAELKTEAALNLVGPREFGLETDYVPFDGPKAVDENPNSREKSGPQRATQNH